MSSSPVANSYGPEQWVPFVRAVVTGSWGEGRPLPEGYRLATIAQLRRAAGLAALDAEITVASVLGGHFPYDGGKAAQQACVAVAPAMAIWHQGRTDCPPARGNFGVSFGRLHRAQSRVPAKQDDPYRLDRSKDGAPGVTARLHRLLRAKPEELASLLRYAVTLLQHAEGGPVLVDWTLLASDVEEWYRDGQGGDVVRSWLRGFQEGLRA